VGEISRAAAGGAAANRGGAALDSDEFWRRRGWIQWKPRGGIVLRGAACE